MSELKGKCELSISRVSSNMEDDFMIIELVDTTSHLRIGEIKMSLLAFTDALTGRMNVPGEIDIKISPNMGKTQETKRVLCPFACFLPLGQVPYAGPHWDTLYQKMVAPFEVDGWKADAEKSRNHHRMRGDTYEVIFRRYV